MKVERIDKKSDTNEEELHTVAEHNKVVTISDALLRVAFVRDLDNKSRVWKLDHTCKYVYAYLCKWGYACGWNNIYPNQDQIADAIGSDIRTVARKIKVLKEVGLIRVVPVRGRSKFISNKYKIININALDRREWLNKKEEKLKGKEYKFDPSIFHKK